MLWLLIVTVILALIFWYMQVVISILYCDVFSLVPLIVSWSASVFLIFLSGKEPVICLC